ncbi:septal ring lytic transglycosylase RlpA family protein [Xenophilus azovorans]|uniref:septal ring lytic transglycosylase RlpA family protein n=1 Tax=Xenophilus azovorans TaxID=151755 RepID=UPI000A01FC50|nr:septal ring lytic transglycosylase RlpA family protein [Xenophilus azovorans]
MRRASAAIRRARWLGAAWLLGLLGGCTTPPAEPPAAAGASAEPLKPLARQAGTPLEAPRSRVPSVRYDLAIGRAEDELPPDDGAPGDQPPGEVYERGGASWYGIQFHQRRTASGERFDMGAFTAAHKKLPFGTRVCVRSLVNGKEVLVRVNDRGPYAAGRVIDLSRAAAEQLDMIGLGIKQVTLTLIGAEGGRCNGAAVDVAENGASSGVDADPAPPAPSARKAAPAPRPARRRR